MMCSIFRRLALVAVCALLGLQLSAASDEGASANLYIKAKLNEQWFLISRSNLATRNYHDEIFIGYTGAGLGYQWTPSLSFRVCYRRFWLKLGDDFEAENRPFVESYHRAEYEGFQISNRTRAEFRFYEYDKADDVRLRHEIVVEAPWTWSRFELKPYAEEELFWNVDNHEVEANWLGLGFSWKPRPDVKMKLGYRWVRQRIGDNWSNRNVIVTGLNFYF